jgi:hypothetical protein
MMTGIFAEVAKALLADADKAFGSGLFGRVAKGLADGPPAPAGIAAAGRAAAAPQPPAAAGTNVWRPAGQTPGGQQNSVPILKQILSVLETLAVKMGIFPRQTSGTPGPMGVRQQVGTIARSLFQAPNQPPQQAGGTAKYHFQQIAHQLAGKPFFKAMPKVPVPAAAGAGGLAGLGRSLLLLGRFAGVAGLVVTGVAAVAGALKAFVGSVLDSNRELAKWNGTLASSVVRLDMTRMRLDMQTAQGTSGTGALMNDEFGKLLTELQPVRQAVGNIANLAATGIVMLGRLYAQGISYGGIWKAFFPKLAFIAEVAEAINEWLGNNKPAQGGPLNDDLKALRNRGPLAGGNAQPGGNLGAGQMPPFLPPMLPLGDRRRRG